MLSDARPGDQALDVGCGTGYLARLMVTAVGPGGRVTGVDPSPPVIDYARRAAPRNCSFVLGEAQQLEFPDSSFDVVTSSLAVHHIPPEVCPAALTEMFRVLRPDGRLLVADFRPPTNPLARRLVGALAGPTMSRNQVSLLHELTGDAGFHIKDHGDIRPCLHYIRATRSA